MAGRQIPSEVLLDCELEDEDALAATFTQMAGYAVRVSSRTRSERARYIRLASTNAQAALLSKLSHKSTQQQRVAQLEELLELQQPIARMECFDISHTMGENTVASCVRFLQSGRSGE